MRKMIWGLALLGAVPLAALAQTSPDRSPPAAATQNNARPGDARPSPGISPRVDSVQNQTPGNATPGTMAPGSATLGNTTTGNATTGASTPNSPVAQGGASMSETQVRERMAAAGFTGVTGLQRDAHGAWHGRAMREGRQADVTLDAQGRVSAR